MAYLNELILLGGGLVLLSIFAGLVSSRFGAPLLLVFLVLGMLAGEDGPGGIDFDDFSVAYVMGSIALAVILFDGGLRTSRETFRVALGPATLLATLGVLVTAVVVGGVAALVFGFGWIEGLLVGSIVASTDAAAVFFLLHLRGLQLTRRVGAVLEVESGLNDPMAVFLTLTCVTLLTRPDVDPGWAMGVDFLVQMLGGILVGLASGYGLVWLINRLELASGLYPILAASGAIVTFAGAQSLGASGFLAVYVAGYLVGNRRHKAAQLIARFHDGLAWLAQIVMFLMLGLLVTPHELVDDLPEAMVVAVVLVLVARPLAVVPMLLPFRFSRREIAFVSWVGLRGAVPIFLGAIPVLAGVPQASSYFNVAFVVVLVSLLVQGWTVARATRYFGLELPPSPPPPHRVDIDLPGRSTEDLTVYTVDPDSAAARRALKHLRLPEGVTLLAVLRDGHALDLDRLERLDPGDTALILARPEQVGALDRLFVASRAEEEDGIFGEFAFEGSLPVGAVAGFYEFPVPPEERERPLDAFIRARLPSRPFVGDRIRVGDIELVVRAIDRGAITEVGIELEPRNWRPPRSIRRAAARLRGAARRALRRRRRR